MKRTQKLLLLAGLLIGTHGALAAQPDPSSLLPPSLDSRDISGVWWSANGDTALRPLKGEIPFIAEGGKIYQARLAGIEDGSVVDAAAERCVPEGTPRVMAAPYPIQIVQTADQVTLLPEIGHAYRQILMNSKHTAPDDVNPSFMGESIGHWDSDVLVVDTIGMKDGVWLDDTGLPLTEGSIHVVERFHKIANGTKLEDVITIEDPKVFAHSWTTRRVYEWRPDVHIEDYVCSDRHRDLAWAKRLPKLPSAIVSRPVEPPVPTGAFDFSGYWRHNKRGEGAGRGEFRNALVTTADGKIPPLQPWAAALLNRNREAIATGHPVTTPNNRCQPSGVPAFWAQPYPYQIQLTHDFAVFLGEADHQFRIIDLNQQHPPDLKPTWYGNSVGHWEGMALVVDTVGQSDRTLFEPAGIPKTEALHVVERFNPSEDGKVLEIRFDADDSGAFTAAWQSVWPLDRQPAGYRMIEYVCAENERDAAGASKRAISHAVGGQQQ